MIKVSSRKSSLSRLYIVRKLIGRLKAVHSKAVVIHVVKCDNING